MTDRHAAEIQGEALSRIQFDHLERMSPEQLTIVFGYYLYPRSLGIFSANRLIKVRNLLAASLVSSTG